MSDWHSVRADHFPGRPKLRVLPDPPESTSPAEEASMAREVGGASTSYDLEGLFRLAREIARDPWGAKP